MTQPSNDMSAPLLEAAVAVEKTLTNLGLPFCFIGGIAVQRWGEPRNTLDLDLTVVAGFGEESSTIDPLLEEFSGRLEDTRDFALAHRVLLLRTPDGIDIDIALGALPFEKRSIERASLFELGELGSITTCSAEDLIVHKAFANRDRDWADIRTIIARQRGKLNWPQVIDELAPLTELKDTPEILTKLAQIRHGS